MLSSGKWPARSTRQATRRHPGASAESCFLPDLTRFTGARRAGPDMARAGREHAYSASVLSLDALPEPVSQVPARALFRVGGPGARHQRAPQRGARRPHQPRVPLLRARAARARPPPPASSPARSTVSSSAPTASPAASARTAWRSRPARSSISSSSTRRRTTGSTRCATSSRACISEWAPRAGARSTSSTRCTCSRRRLRTRC